MKTGGPKCASPVERLESFLSDRRGNDRPAISNVPSCFRTIDYACVARIRTTSNRIDHVGDYAGSRFQELGPHAGRRRRESHGGGRLAACAAWSIGVRQIHDAAVDSGARATRWWHDYN